MIVMTALLPPANAASINLPPAPQNPPVFSDIGHAVAYVDELCHSMLGKMFLYYKLPSLTFPS
jgi:hypothetical protein